MTIVCNKEICDISFNVLHVFPVRDFFAYLPLILILNYNVGKMGVMCWPFFNSHSGASQYQAVMVSSTQISTGSYKCCSKASPPVIPASLHFSFPGEHQPFKGNQVPQSCQGGIPVHLRGQLLYTAQLVLHKLQLMLLIRFQGLLCQNMEQLRGTENAAAESAWKPLRQSVKQHSWVLRRRSGNLVALSVGKSRAQRAFICFCEKNLRAGVLVRNVDL